MSGSERSRAKREKAIAALLKERTVKDAALEAGIGETTLRRWLGDASFQTEYRAARARIFDHVLNQIRLASSEAVQTLRSVMLDALNPPTARVAAVRTLLDLLLRGSVALDLEERVQELEKVLGSVPWND